MTRARHPKQFCPSTLEEPCKRIHRGIIIEEESGSRIWEDLGGIWVQTSGRHLGGILEASQEHLGGIWEASWRLRWPRGAQGHCGKEWCHYAAECKKFPHLFEGDISYHRISTATYAERQRATNKENIKAPGQRRENPYREMCGWGMRSLSICMTPARDPEQHFASLHTTGR